MGQKLDPKRGRSKGPKTERTRNRDGARIHGSSRLLGDGRPRRASPLDSTWCRRASMSEIGSAEKCQSSSFPTRVAEHVGVILLIPGPPYPG